MILVWLERVWQDLRHGARIFAKNPGFTAIAVLSIAFGTGANVAIFSVVDAMLLRPLPAARPDELLAIGTDVQRGRIVFKAASYPDYLDIRERATTLTGVLAYEFEPIAIAARAGDVPRVKLVTLISSNFFDVLDQPLTLGRSFPRAFDAPDGREHPEVIISHSFWNAEFSGDRSVLGKTLRLAGLDFTIVGVGPEGFTGLHPYVRDTMFVPLTMWRQLTHRPGVDPLIARDFRDLQLKGRLAPGRSIRDVRAELGSIGAALEAAYPATNRRQEFTANTELEHRFTQRPLDAALMLILTILSIGVLCVACANVAGLLASRAPVRAREMALRLAVGASRSRLIVQLITESFGIALAGALGGLFVGWAGMRVLGEIQFPTDMAAPPPLVINERALIFSLAVASASAILVGFGPALQMTRVRPGSGLRTTETNSGRTSRIFGRNVLVAVQVALSLVLVTITVYALEVFSNVLGKGPGLRIERMAIGWIDPGQARYPEARAEAFFEDLLDRTRRLPGVQSASVASAMPMFSSAFARFAPEGYHPPDGQFGASVWSNRIDEDYFETMGIPLLRGRAFLTSDRRGTSPVAIVNNTIAQRYWPGENPVGKRFRVIEGDPWIEVVGVAETSSLMFPGEVPQEAIYLPFRQHPATRMTLLAATQGDSASLLGPLRAVAAEIDPLVPVSDVQTVEAFYDARATVFARVMTKLIGAMGVMGIALTMVGLYGLVSYSVSRRTREIGIRIAIGATSTRILSMILEQGMRPAWLGLAAGLPLTTLTVRLLDRLTPFSYTYDRLYLLVAVPVMLLVTLLAALLPARRAAGVEPIVALRCE